MKLMRRRSKTTLRGSKTTREVSKTMRFHYLATISALKMTN
jgi:hypothetical protein